jgi:hypothetical protein
MLIRFLAGAAGLQKIQQGAGSRRIGLPGASLLWPAGRCWAYYTPAPLPSYKRFSCFRHHLGVYFVGCEQIRHYRILLLVVDGSQLLPLRVSLRIC